MPVIGVMSIRKWQGQIRLPRLKEAMRTGVHSPIRSILMTDSVRDVWRAMIKGVRVPFTYNPNPTDS